MKKISLLIASIFVLFMSLLVSCQSDEQPTDEKITSANEEIPQLEPVSTIVDVGTRNAQPAVIKLTFWITEKFAAQSDLLNEQLADFERANRHLNVETVLKRNAGPAGILNFLLSAHSVAPGVLPDVVILSSDDLPKAWRNDLIQPLDGQIDSTIIEDLLPAARMLGTVDGQLAGVPFEMNVEHIIYNTNQISSSFVLWDDVLSQNIRYQFPAQGPNNTLSHTILGQYLSAGGTLMDEEGNVAINDVALKSVLTYYQSAIEHGIIDDTILDISTTEDLWDKYLAGSIDVIHTNTHKYLTDRRLLNDTKIAPIPSQKEKLVIIGQGWVLAIVTKDSIRQTEAIRLVQSLISAEANAAWSSRSAVIPTRKTAFELVAGDDPYWTFLREYLNSVTAPPNFVGYEQLSRILQQAVVQVIHQEATPDEAVQTALNALQ
ncbi:MAG: hypothetical protein B6242_11110 [Anaerolineaceae bacterium 4572_78]|nr:MAG: hypothetical protein B6242_11110 [Anaerolineaceae bacterium 4572_78]